MLAPTAMDFSSGKVGTNGTDKSVPYSYGFWCRQNRYIWKQCSAYGADILTPHLPQAVFQWRFYAGTDTFFASARPVGAGKTYTYCNKVAPTARIY